MTKREWENWRLDVLGCMVSEGAYQVARRIVMVRSALMMEDVMISLTRADFVMLLRMVAELRGAEGMVSFSRYLYEMERVFQMHDDVCPRGVGCVTLDVGEGEGEGGTWDGDVGEGGVVGEWTGAGRVVGALTCDGDGDGDGTGGSERD